MRIQKTVLYALLLKAFLLPLPLMAAGYDGPKLDPMPVKLKEAKYPVKALSMDEEGWVLIEANLDRFGQITDAEVLDAQNGHLFRRSAMEIVSEYLEDDRSIGAPQTKKLKVVYSIEDKDWQ